VVRVRARATLAADPENADAQSYLAMTEQGLAAMETAPGPGMPSAWSAAWAPLRAQRTARHRVCTG
jgi:hypothetical protein